MLLIPKAAQAYSIQKGKSCSYWVHEVGFKQLNEDNAQSTEPHTYLSSSDLHACVRNTATSHVSCHSELTILNL